MKFLFSLFSFSLFAACSGSEVAADTSAPGDSGSRSTSSVAPESNARSPVFDPVACDFLTEAEIKNTLGDRISQVSIQDANAGEGHCLKVFILTLADGASLRLVFNIVPVTQADVENEIREFRKNAETIPRLMKMEPEPDGKTYIGTHVSQRRLYLLQSGQETFITLSYDVRGAQGGKTPEEVEARRQMGIMLLRELLRR